jgi:glyoxylase-like metal-dependent hydrolase (beta-lactamase superfamily II)
MSYPEPVALPDGVRLVDDRHLGRPHVIGTYLLLGDEPALFDPGPASTLANLEDGLAAHGVGFDDLRAVLLTHIHLDHAGATGALVRRCPRLRVYVHQRGAPHIVDPAKLIRSAARIYGDALERLWGVIEPVPEGNVAALAGGETLRLGRRALRVFDAPGHASHHVFYFEEASGAAFLGDAGGVCQPDAPVARPATPPPEIDIEAWLRTLDAIGALDPRALLLTHFGPAYEPRAYLADYRAALLRWAEAVRAGLESGEDEAAQVARLRDLARADLGRGAAGDTFALYEQASSVEMNWQGLARYWRKRLGGA